MEQHNIFMLKSHLDSHNQYKLAHYLNITFGRNIPSDLYWPRFFFYFDNCVIFYQIESINDFSARAQD